MLLLLLLLPPLLLLLLLPLLLIITTTTTNNNITTTNNNDNTSNKTIYIYIYIYTNSIHITTTHIISTRLGSFETASGPEARRSAPRAHARCSFIVFVTLFFVFSVFVCRFLCFKSPSRCSFCLLLFPSRCCLLSSLFFSVLFSATAARRPWPPLNRRGLDSSPCVFIHSVVCYRCLLCMFLFLRCYCVCVNLFGCLLSLSVVLLLSVWL